MRAPRAEARDVSPTRSPLTSNQSMPVAAHLGVDVGSLAVQRSEPVKQQHGRLRLDVTPAHRQSFDRCAAQSDRRRRSAIRIALTLVNNGDQQQADHTSLAKLFHRFLSW
jgi:hypothetical protein